MAADALDDFARSTGVNDVEGLKSDINNIINRYRRREDEDQAHQTHLVRASNEYFVGWKFVELTVRGKIPPRCGVREYDARVESGDMILAKYSRQPHIRAVLINPDGILFKVGIVVSFKQHLSHNQITFNNFKLSIGVDVVPSGTVHEEERKVVINSLFDYLYKHHYRFVKDLESRAGDLRALVFIYAQDEQR